MKVLKTDELDNIKIDNLYTFLSKTNNITNKININNNIIWNIIYLRKIFNKSIKSKRSRKEIIKFNYVITNNNEIICFFSLHFIRKDADIDIVDLSFIITENYYNTETIKLIQEEYNRLSQANSNLCILAVYIPINLIKAEKTIDNATEKNSNNIIENCEFQMAFMDNKTYQEENLVYYYINNDQDYKTDITRGNIIQLLMKQYGLNEIINPRSELRISRKLTQKSLSIHEYKVITKNIFDIKEIQDLPEYDYDYFNIYSVKFFSFISYLLQNKNPNIHDFIMKRFFSSLKFNKYIFNIYFALFNYIYKLGYINTIHDSIFDIKYLTNVNNQFIQQINNFYIEKILLKNNKKNLIITNSIDTIKYFNKFKIDIIRTKNLFNFNEDVDTIKKLNNNNIFITNNNREFKQILQKNNTKYNYIFIENNYPTLDMLLLNANILCKISYIITTILSALKHIHFGGSLYISMIIGNFNIPSIKKIFALIISLFESYNFENLGGSIRNYILFNNFKGLNNTNEKIINSLLNIFSDFEKNEFDFDDLYEILISNKFTYHINNDNLNELLKDNSITNLNNNNLQNNLKNKLINKTIPYDILKFPIINELNINTFIKKHRTKIINNYEKYQKIFIKSYEKNNNSTLNKKHFINMIIQYYIVLFQFVEKYNLIDDVNIDTIINLLQTKKQNNIE